MMSKYLCNNCGKEFGQLIDIKSEGVFSDTQIETYICDYIGWFHNGCGHKYKIRTNKNTGEFIEYIEK